MMPVDSLRKTLKKFNDFKLENLPPEKCKQLVGNIDQKFVELEAEANRLYGSA